MPASLLRLAAREGSWGRTCLTAELDNLITTRTGRKLEVREYGDPAGHPALFFHGLIGSHYQASYIAEQARRQDCGSSHPIGQAWVSRSSSRRQIALEAVPDIEDLTAALRDRSVQRDRDLGRYALCSGLPVSAGFPHPDRDDHQRHGSDATPRRTARHGAATAAGPGDWVSLSATWPGRNRDAGASVSGRQPTAFLKRLVSRPGPPPDQKLFEGEEIFDLFLDLQQVFIDGNGPETFCQELRLYRNYGFSPAELPGIATCHALAGLSTT